MSKRVNGQYLHARTQGFTALHCATSNQTGRPLVICVRDRYRRGAFSIMTLFVIGERCAHLGQQQSTADNVGKRHRQNHQIRERDHGIEQANNGERKTKEYL